MGKFDVVKVGTDTSGRGIYMTNHMKAWWDTVSDRLGFTPTIVQGAWMSKNGGGAAASAGYHDYGGCLDLRVWDRTADEVQKVIKTTRSLGAASWVRDQAHGGFDPHIHLVLAGDGTMASGATWQVAEYKAGRNGLSSQGSDYHWRPDPLVVGWDGPVEVEDEVKPEDIDKIANAVWAKEIGAHKNRAAAKAHLLWASNASRNTRSSLLAQSRKIRAAINKIPEGVTKAEVRELLDHLDATINLVVKDEDPA